MKQFDYTPRQCKQRCHLAPLTRQSSLAAETAGPHEARVMTPDKPCRHPSRLVPENRSLPRAIRRACRYRRFGPKL